MSEPQAREKQTLPAEAVAEIEALRPKYPTTGALLLPALHIAQRHAGGWLPEPVMDAVAELLEIPATKVYGVVTFYDLFYDKPVGKHRISVCTNLSCLLRGAQELLDTLHDELGVEEGEVTADGRCSFVHFECLGSCDTAPMMMIDDQYHENLTPEQVREIVRELDG